MFDFDSLVLPVTLFFKSKRRRMIGIAILVFVSVASFIEMYTQASDAAIGFLLSLAGGSAALYLGLGMLRVLYSNIDSLPTSALRWVPLAIFAVFVGFLALLISFGWLAVLIGVLPGP